MSRARAADRTGPVCRTPRHGAHRAAAGERADRHVRCAPLWCAMAERISAISRRRDPRAGAFAKNKERVQMKNLTVVTGRREPSPAAAADEEVQLTIGAGALADVRAAIVELYRDELDAVRDEYERIAADVTRPLDAGGVARLAAAHRRLAAITARFDP